MKPFFYLLFFFGFIHSAPAQHIISLAGNGSVQTKNYYLLTLLQQNVKVKKLLEHDKVLATVAKQKSARLQAALTECEDYKCLTALTKFSAEEIKTVENRLMGLYDNNKDIQSLVIAQLIPSGMYFSYQALAPKQQFLTAWEQDANGINRAIGIYAEGQKPNYPNIDSISFNVNNSHYLDTVRDVLNTVIGKTKNSLSFFSIPLTSALAFLNINGRNNAADYEPMAVTVNKAALEKAKTINWDKYAYTVILVPGEGPETKDVALSPGGVVRCKLAAKAYADGLAPFIIVSGGKVHPYKTKYCEAEEMKKYLVQTLQLPENAVLLEPHARHTTTNLRNAARLIIRYGLPLTKPGLIVSDKLQCDYITNMGARCIKELHYVPYRLDKRLSANALEFYPLTDALQANPYEPMDP